MSKYCIYRLENGQSARQWCKENNVTYNKFTYYLNKGLLVEDACQLALKPRKQPLSLKGKSIRTSMPVNMYNSVLKHIRDKKVSIEKAIELYNFNKCHRYMLPTNTKPVINTKTGKIYSTIKECAKELGISQTCLGLKIRKGYYIEYYKGENK